MSSINGNGQGNVTSMETKLDNVWREVSKEKAVDFFKRAVGPQTTVRELSQILSYDKIAELREQIGDVAIGEVMGKLPRVEVTPRVPTPTPTPSMQRRWRSSRIDIEREEIEVLAIVRDNPGINRGQLARKVKSKLGNKSLAHVSYLLRRLGEQGKVVKSGERKATVYQASGQ